MLEASGVSSTNLVLSGEAVVSSPASLQCIPPSLVLQHPRVVCDLVSVV